MKLKYIYLLLLHCITLFSACTYGSGKSNDISATKGKAQIQQTEKTVVTANTVADQNAVRVIEDFYKEYIKALLQPDHLLADLPVKKYFTKGLIEKVKRLGIATGTDPIIRAQDVNGHMLKTIKAKNLENNWYMVEYDWYPSGDRGHQEIPLRVTHANGHYMIDYITPIWSGSSYGNRLLLNNFSKQPIDTSSPMSLLKTFYTAYAAEYCSMPESLVPRLEALRKLHLTPNALAQFEQSANEHKLDSEFNYDLLIDGFDFDCLWIPSLTFKQIDGNTTYQMRYKKSSVVTLEVIGYNGEYKIDKIHIEK